MQKFLYLIYINRNIETNNSTYKMNICFDIVITKIKP